MGKLIIAGNWKMNGVRQSVSDFVNVIKNRGNIAQKYNMEIIIFPPFTLLNQFSESSKNTGIRIGSQNVSQHLFGAFTGEISIKMLEDLGCQYVIVGHSERRAIYNEDAFLISSKYVTAINSNLQPILCVGETLTQKRSMQTLSTISRQLDFLLGVLKQKSKIKKKIIIAYEPFWSIGTGMQPSYQEICDISRFIRSKINGLNMEYTDKTKILYGGSVDIENVSNLPTYPIIDGLLIGKSSLSANQFLDIGIKFSRNKSKS